MRRFVLELVRDLSGRTQHLFAELLVEQLDATIEAGRLVDEVVRGHLGVLAARVAMTRVEHAGDSRRAQLIYELLPLSHHAHRPRGRFPPVPVRGRCP